ncbi:hypothetical protein GCM10011506_42680 [Marivirga lumbricoides]|nr:hypothetical protein GCM10011506_42680 [Marivirga lumbricoides]
MQYLEDAEIRNEIHTYLIDVDKLTQHSRELIREAIEEMEGIQADFHSLKISFNTIYLFEQDKHLVYEPDYLFNRYRMITLRSALYNKFQPLDVQKVRNYCRTKEGEALKSGLKDDIWSYSSGEKVFGVSEQPGDFTGKGSSGWKFLALSQLMADCFFYEKGIFLRRITPYDNLMFEGKIIQIGQPLKLKNVQYKRPLINFIARQLKHDLS